MARKSRNNRRRSKPAATIDLKATEIDPDEGVVVIKPADKDEAAMAAKVALAGANKPDAALGSNASARPSAAPRKEDEIYKKSVSDKVNFKHPDENGPDMNADAAPIPPVKVKSGGGFFSHGLSGILGGLLVFFGLNQFSDQLAQMAPGFIKSSGAEVGALSSRIKALENNASGKSAGRSPQLVQRVAQVEEQVAVLSGSSQSLFQKTQALEKAVKSGTPLGAASTSSGAKSGSPSGKMTAELKARLDDLEAKLAGLSAATLQHTNAPKNNGAASGRQSTLGIAAIKQQNAEFNSRLGALRKDLAAKIVQATQAQQAEFSKLAAAATPKTEITQLQTTLGELQRQTAGMRSEAQELKSKLAALPDVGQAIGQGLAPVTEKVGALEQQVAGVMNREAAARLEGRNTALVIALGNLKSALAQEKPYAAVLDAFTRMAPKDVDTSTLGKHARFGIPTLPGLVKDFEEKSRHALAAEQTSSSGGWADQVWANARNVVQVKRTGPIEGDSSAAIISRMDFALHRGELEKVLAEGNALKGESRKVLQHWLDQATARHTANTTIATLEARLLAALGSSTN